MGRRRFTVTTVTDADDATYTALDTSPHFRASRVVRKPYTRATDSRPVATTDTATCTHRTQLDHPAPQTQLHNLLQKQVPALRSGSGDSLRGKSGAAHNSRRAIFTGQDETREQEVFRVHSRERVVTDKHCAYRQQYACAFTLITHPRV